MECWVAPKFREEEQGFRLKDGSWEDFVLLRLLLRKGGQPFILSRVEDVLVES